MSFRALYFLLFVLVWSGLGGLARGGETSDTPYTDRGKTDFDTVLRLLNPYGTWSKINGEWAYTPLDHKAPYTEGRWMYTEYGWYWKGRLPYSWATEHYGYWKRGTDKIWSWYPGPYWLPEIIEIRASNKYIGWRSGEVDSDGNYVEAPIDRYSKTDEWTFVTLEQFANPITPDLIAPLDVARKQLEDSTDCRHTYLTYREIDRPGPHPADFADLCNDGGMLAPPTIADEIVPPTPPTAPVSTNSPAAHMTGTNQPTLLGTEIDPSADTRKVKYWITMSLPNFWALPPDDSKPGQIYLYRPDFYQDQDGIERRITLWFNPNARTSLSEALGQSQFSPGALSQPGKSTAIPAMPADTDALPSHNAFQSPLDESFHSGSASHSTSASTKASTPAPTNVPDGLAAPSPATNAAPAK